MSPPDGQAGSRAQVCALLTCFNRRSKTIACLDALAISADQAGVQLSAVLVDDRSTDGTADAVRQRFSWVRVHDGAGDLYWCRGMHQAYTLAAPLRPDFFLWINDDTLVRPEAVSELMASARACQAGPAVPLILVGSCRDSGRVEHSYGGVRFASRWIRTRFAKVPPSDQIQPLDTFDGNLVLVSQAAAAQIGNLDPGFEHAMGDYDYGLRARRLGVPCLLAPGWHAVCDDNPRTGTYMDSSLGLGQRLSLMFSRKGLPPRSWWRFNWRHGGALWLLTFAWPYLRVTVQGLRRRRVVRTG